MTRSLLPHTSAARHVQTFPHREAALWRRLLVVATPGCDQAAPVALSQAALGVTVWSERDTDEQNNPRS